MIALRGNPGGPATPTQHIACASRLEPARARLVHLAELLELDPGQLMWLADARGLERATPHHRLRNYTYRWQPRPDGPPRPIARPKRRLKEIQRWILHGSSTTSRSTTPRTASSPDRLKAILHDVAHHGPAAANRDDVPDFRAHLQGRIAWVGQLHPPRGEKLQARFDAIAW